MATAGRIFEKTEQEIGKDKEGKKTKSSQKRKAENINWNMGGRVMSLKPTLAKECGGCGEQKTDTHKLGKCRYKMNIFLR